MSVMTELNGHTYELTHKRVQCYYIFFFFNDTATTEIYTLSLHDALPISDRPERRLVRRHRERPRGVRQAAHGPVRGHEQSPADRKSTRLNSSHANISYAVFCLKKKKKLKFHTRIVQ